MRDIIWRILKIWLIVTILIIMTPVWLVIGFIIFSIFDNTMFCKDRGLLWDKHQRICRSDCPTLVYPHGCFFLPPKDQMIWKACVEMPLIKEKESSIPCHRDQIRRIMRDLCDEYDHTWDETNGACDFFDN